MHYIHIVLSISVFMYEVTEQFQVITNKSWSVEKKWKGYQKLSSPFCIVNSSNEAFHSNSDSILPTRILSHLLLTQQLPQSDNTFHQEYVWPQWPKQALSTRPGYSTRHYRYIRSFVLNGSTTNLYGGGWFIWLAGHLYLTASGQSSFYSMKIWKQQQQTNNNSNKWETLAFCYWEQKVTWAVKIRTNMYTCI